MKLKDARRVLLGGLSAVVAFAVLAQASVAANWVQPVAAPLNANPAKDAEVPRMAVIGGVPYVAWRESDGSTFGIRVAKLVGGRWVRVGSPLDSNSSSYFRSPAIAAVGNVPFLAWMQLSGGGHEQVEASRWSGTSWSAVGGSLNVDPNQGAEQPTIVGVGNVPYIAWDEYNASPSAEQVHVARFDGTNWVPVGGVLNANPNEHAFNPSIAVIGSVLYVAFQEYNGSNFQIRVASFNGTSWVPVGGVVNVDPNAPAEIPSIAGVGGVPWVAWDEQNGAPHLVHVAAFKGGSWHIKGSPLSLKPELGAFEADIANISGIPYVAWRDQATGVPQVHVVKWTSAGAWAQVGGALNVNPSHDARTPSMIAVGGLPYVAWQEMSSSSGGVFQIRVKQLVNAPDTTISSSQIKARRGTASFAFTAVGQATGFQCELLSAGHNPGFTSCSSAKAYTHLRPARYTFEVRAVGPGGIDPTPATKTFRIKPKRRRTHH